MIEIRQNKDGSVDEVVCQCPSFFHLEDLGDGNWYLRVDAISDTEHYAIVNITPKRAFVYESRNAYVVCSEEKKEEEHSDGR